MSTLSAFYIKAPGKAPVITALQKITGIKELTETKKPEPINKKYLTDESAKPTNLLIANTQTGWITVLHNSTAKLSDWGASLSKELDTVLIIIAAQTVSDYYYFSFFEKGKKLREIEVCYSDDFKAVNFGKKFPFETTRPGQHEEDDDFFGFEEIEMYCSHFGLTIQADHKDVSWTILKTKPWWKFW